MFRRLLFEDSAVLFTVAAFVTAFSIYVTIAWRAVRMKRPQAERFGNLPFETPTPACVALRVSAGTEPPHATGRSCFSRSGLQESSPS